MKRAIAVVFLAVVMLYLLLFIYAHIKGIGLSGSSALNMMLLLISWPLLAAAQVVPAYVAARFTKGIGWLVGALIGALVVVPAAADLVQEIVRSGVHEGGVLVFSPGVERFSWSLSFVVLGSFSGLLGQAHRAGCSKAQPTVQPEVPASGGSLG